MKCTKAERLNNLLPYAFGNELKTLTEVALSLPPNPHAMVIGAGPGIMSMALLEARDDIIVSAVDNNATTLDTYVIHLSTEGFQYRIRVFNYNSIEAASLIQDETFDLIIIDADHSYSAVLADTIAWEPLLKSGGILWFHDYIDLEKNGTNGVAEAISILRETRLKKYIPYRILETGEEEIFGTSIIYRKP